MDDRKRDLSRYRLEQAAETMQVAETCFNKQFYRDTLNRSYYAAFYAVKAVLALDGVDFKRHKDAVAYFNQHYVKEERLPREIGRKLGELKRLRETSDYDDFYIVSADQAREQLEAAREINEAIRQFLNEVQDGSGLNKFFGSLPDIGDGMEIQKKARGEWDE